MEFVLGKYGYFLLGKYESFLCAAPISKCKIKKMEKERKGMCEKDFIGEYNKKKLHLHCKVFGVLHLLNELGHLIDWQYLH